MNKTNELEKQKTKQLLQKIIDNDGNIQQTIKEKYKYKKDVVEKISQDLLDAIYSVLHMTEERLEELNEGSVISLIDQMKKFAEVNKLISGTPDIAIQVNTQNNAVSTEEMEKFFHGPSSSSSHPEHADQDEGTIEIEGSSEETS